MTTTRIPATRHSLVEIGTIRTTEVIRALDGNFRPYGWHLIVNGDWHETYPTKREAIVAGEHLRLLAPREE